MNVYDALEKVLGKKVAENSTVFNLPRINSTLTKGVTIAGAAAAEIIKLNEAATLGPITAGKLSDMTDNVGISPGIKDMENQNAKSITEKTFKGNVMDSAASGEIVLALHKLR